MAGESEWKAKQCPQCGGSLTPGGEQVICPYCGTRLVRYAVAGQPEPQMLRGMRFKPYSTVDNQVTGLEVFGLLIPVGWDVQGGVQWRMDNPAMPAIIAWRTANPAGCEALEFFPVQSFTWSQNPMLLSMFPVGSFYMGAEVRPPAPALDTLRGLLVPRFRGQMPGLSITAEEHLPGLPGQIRQPQPLPGTQFSDDGVRVRLRYEMGGTAVEEDVFCVMEYVTVPMGWGVPPTVYWYADYLFSFRAAAGQLDGLADLFTFMVRSTRINPAWVQQRDQIVHMLTQNKIRQINSIGQLSRMISRTQSEISDMMMSSWQERQQTYDRLATNFSQYIRGVDEYRDPVNQTSVELPTGYDRAWTNGLGEYIITDDPNFDPNIGSTQNWHAMPRGPAGE